jgi:undecaprenyl-diphosphatase
MHRRVWCDAGLVVALVLAGLTLLVLTGATTAVDVLVFQWLRPGDAWDSGQQRIAPLMHQLHPSRVLLAAASLGLLVTAVTRSWRPLCVCVGAITGAALANEVLQRVVGRLDPHAGYYGGSYPSGHTTAVVVAAGLGALLTWGSRAAASLVAILAGSGMGFVLLVTGSHWFTDVVGGLLLGTLVVLMASRATRAPRSAVRRTPHPPTERTRFAHRKIRCQRGQALPSLRTAHSAEEG